MIKLAPGSTTPVPSTIISSEPSLVPGPSMDNGLKRTSLLGGEDPNRPSRIKIAGRSSLHVIQSWPGRG